MNVFFWVAVAVAAASALGPHLWGLATYQLPRLVRAVHRRITGGGQ